jgi:predicted RNA-binding protein YlqC (UPF0109 family)
MKDLVEHIVKALVEYPEDVKIEIVEGTQATVLELRTHPDDIGRVIGRDGRTISVIRTLLGAIGTKLHKRYTLEVLKERDPDW